LLSASINMFNLRISKNWYKPLYIKNIAFNINEINKFNNILFYKNYKNKIIL